MADITKDQVIEWLSGLSVLDIAALVKELEDKWGVSAAAPVAVVAGGAAAAPAEEKDAFDVILKSVDASKKISVIKEVRAIHLPRPRRSQGPRRRRPQGNQGRRRQGGSRRDRQEAQGRRRRSRSQVSDFGFTALRLSRRVRGAPQKGFRGCPLFTLKNPEAKKRG